MNKSIIEVKNLSKKYTLGERQPYYSFRDTISGIFHTPFRREKLEKDEFWALKDVSFDINEGDVIGVIGRNGAGKSTLLKILSQITPPTEGEVKLRGRVASLLEVGTGFHPELTGRENIYLNGAILGMKRWEINNKFKEIVDFSEIEKFLDTPVKHYSSGMYMRLAFAVAAHLEPEILLIDEVLSVGDIDFQKKCLGKMDEVSKKEGRTVIFVSHDIGAIKHLCNKCILLSNGNVSAYGSTEDVVTKYKGEKKSETVWINKHHDGKILNINKVNVEDVNGVIKKNYLSDEQINIRLEVNIRDVPDKLVTFIKIENNDEIIFMVPYVFPKKIKHGKHILFCKIPSHFLNAGIFFVSIDASIFNISSILVEDKVVNFSVERPYEVYGLHLSERYPGSILPKLEWEIS